MKFTTSFSRINLPAILMVLTVLLGSCLGRDGDEIIQVKDQYQIWVPKSLFKADDLNEDASLQYMNALDELYVIVIDESMEELNEAFTGLYDSVESFEGFEFYVNLVSSSFFDALELDPYPQLEKTTINDLPAMVTGMDATADGIAVTYECAFVKGRDHYYQIIAWTLTDRKEKMQQKMDKMIASFAEISSEP